MTGDVNDVSLDVQEARRAHAEHMIDVLRAVEDGDLSVRVDLGPDGADALAVLAVALNSAIEQFARVREDTQRYQRTIEEQIGTIEEQRSAIRRLSTPIIEVLDGVLCLPMVGVLDSSRAVEMGMALVQTVVDKKARLVVIDVTGIDLMDTATTDHFLRMARSVSMLGAECVLSGVKPNVAQAIVAIGVDTTGIPTFRNLRAALQRYIRRS